MLKALVKCYNCLKPLTNSLRASLLSTCCLTRPECWIWESGRNSFLCLLKSSEVLSPVNLGHACARASLLPQQSLGCESQRLEVSGPGGCKVFEEACGGKRAISCFNLLSLPETTGFFLHKVENVLENVINIRVLFSPLSPQVFSHFFCLCFFSPTVSLNPF